MQKRGEQRDRLTAGIFTPEDKEEALGRYEYAFRLSEEAAPVYKKIYKATKKKELPKTQARFVVDQALEKNIINEEEAELLSKAEDARVDMVQVDEFTLEEYQNQTPSSPKIEESAHPEEITK